MQMGSWERAGRLLRSLRMGVEGVVRGEGISMACTGQRHWDCTLGTEGRRDERLSAQREEVVVVEAVDVEAEVLMVMSSVVQ